MPSLSLVRTFHFSSDRAIFSTVDLPTISYHSDFVIHSDLVTHSDLVIHSVLVIHF